MQSNSIIKLFACALFILQTTLTMDNPDGSNPTKQLIEAIRADDLNRASNLLNLEADPNASFRDAQNNTLVPLEVAIHHGPQICSLLIAHGAIITPRAYTLSAQSGLLPIIQLFLDNQADVNLRSKFLDRTPLIAAAWSGKEHAPEICRLLINAGANVNAKTKPFGAHSHPITALGGAVKGGNPKNIPLLLDAGADALAFFAHRLFSEKIISLLAKNHPALLPSCVFIPRHTIREESRNRILTFLLCCLRLKPSLPRDIQTFILTKSPTDFGNHMITRKLHGKPIPFFAQQATADTLYDATVMLLKKETDEQLPKKFEQLSGDKIKETIARRLAQEKLLCNNPSESFEISSAEELAQNSNENE